jgi:hypothetical protein
MIVEEVAKKGRHTITGLRARCVDRRTSRAVGALVTPLGLCNYGDKIDCKKRKR